jgi:glycosidase
MRVVSCSWLAAALVLGGCASHRAPDGAPAAAESWQLEWARGAVFYEVFVRSFADSDGDGIGDLPGLTARLDYLNDGNPETTNDLGVDGLWLMPVFASPSYHGYDTIDYETVNPQYGTNEDLKRLCDEAHRRGMRVIVDLMINHTGRDHPWFLASASSPRDPKRSWYVWRQDDPGWKQPWGDGNTWHERNGAYYYGIFWAGMPDLNFRTPSVREEIHRLGALWLDRGLDGYRLDAARHIVEDGPGDAQNDTPETHAWWREFSARIRARHPEALLVGENWTDTQTIATYYDELPANFNFPVASAIVDGVEEGDAGPIAAALREAQAAYPEDALDAPFLTNHDMVRLATQLGGDPEKLRSAAAVLLTLPGMPFLYYGEEVGLRNGPGRGDEAKRTPMPWNPEGERLWHPFAPGRETDNVAAQRGDPGSLLSHYRTWIAARHASPALKSGTLRLIPDDEAGPGLLAFWRVSDEGNEAVLVAHNLSGEAAHRTLATGPGIWRERGAPRLLVGGEGARLVQGMLVVHLPPYASGAWVFPLGPKVDYDPDRAVPVIIDGREGR